MQATLRWLTENPSVWIAPSIVFGVTVVIAAVVRQIFLSALRSWTKRTQSRAGIIFLDAVRVPTILWIIILAAHLSIQSSELPPRAMELGPKLLVGLWIISVTLMFMRVARDGVRYYGSQIAGATPVTSLTQNLAQAAVLILGLLPLLRLLGVEITPILTALGVGGIAVALALQDTLSNLFAGFYVAVAGQVRLGDYIKLNTGEEGYVSDISWRSATIRALSNNMIIVPNAKLAQAIVTNYHLPEKRMSASLQVTVSPDSDPDQVEGVLLQLARKAAREVPGMLPEPEPSVAFDPGFGESGLGFTVNYNVAEFVNQFGVRNEMRKRILAAFRKEGIEIPFSRGVYLERERA